MTVGSGDGKEEGMETIQCSRCRRGDWCPEDGQGREGKPDPEKLIKAAGPLFPLIPSAFQRVWQAATAAEFERLYGKLVALINVDIAGDFDAALEQYRYNVERSATREALERARKAMCGECRRGNPVKAPSGDRPAWHLVGKHTVDCSASPICALMGEEEKP